MSELILSLAQVVHCTEAEGPGRRFAVWFQGCPLRCPGCCNPEMLPFEGGTAWTLETLAGAMVTARNEHGVEGISLLGGEPVAHLDAAVAVAQRARAEKLSVMVFSGYTIEEIRAAQAGRLLEWTDVLVDGAYRREQPEPRRRWVGSANQRVHFLTSRYSPDDPCWSQPNTLEIRLRGGELMVNGYPAPAITPFWRRPATTRLAHD